jgi:8-oxo-dGTP diphosphatase
MKSFGSSPTVGAGAVVWRSNDVLIVKRGTPPRLHEWSIPGGKVEWGETVEQTVHREVREETGLTIEIVGLIGVVDALIRDKTGSIARHYVLVDFVARFVSGELHPADDVMEAHWVPFDRLDDYPMWEETRRIIAASRKLL